MNRQITLEQYRAIDLAILAVVMAAAQFLIYLATAFWYPEQLYVVSPVAVLVALVMMRWGGWGGIHAIVGGLVFTALSAGSPEQYLIYGGGNLAGLGALVWFRIFGKENVRAHSLKTLLFALTVQGLMWLGRGALALLVGYPAEAALGFLTTDSLSCVFTLFVVWIVRRIDGLFEDQKTYLLRIERERQTERRDQF